MASENSLRHITVDNIGNGHHNVALLVTQETTHTLAADLVVLAQGNGDLNHAILLLGSNSEVTLEQVTAVAENGIFNHGIRIQDDVTTTLRNSSFTGRGGQSPVGIANYSNPKPMIAINVIALGENGSSINRGLDTYNGTVTLYGGNFVGKGGTSTIGIENTYTSTLKTENITVLGENGSGDNKGLYNSQGASTTLSGGSYTGSGGVYAYGIYNSGSGTTLDAEGVTALGENGSSSNIGIYLGDNAVSTLLNGSFNGRGGANAYGINNWSTKLYAESVTALAENGTDSDTGLMSHLTDSVTLRGGSFIGRGGVSAYGIRLLGMSFDAEFITALGEDSSSNNYGFYHTDSSSTNIHQSILGGATNSIWSEYGYFTVSNSRLIGGSVYTDTGDVTCVLVTRGTNISTDGSTCP
jgi:hypothetical protein